MSTSSNFTYNLRANIVSHSRSPGGPTITTVTPTTVGPVSVFDQNAPNPNPNGRPDGNVATASPNIQPDSYIVYLEPGATANVTNGNNSTDIISDNDGFQFGNRANKLVLNSSNDVVNVLQQNGVVAVSGTNEAVTIQGAFNVLNLDDGSSGHFTTLLQTDITVGDGVADPHPGTPPTFTAPIDLEVGYGTTIDLNDPVGQEVVVLHGDSDTINATLGYDTIFAANNGACVINAQQASFEYVGSTTATTGTSTITGGTGNAVVFANNGVTYTEGPGSNVFVGGVAAQIPTLYYGTTTQITVAANHSTVTGTTGHDTLYGGTVGDLYKVGDASELYVGGGGVDTIMGGSVAPTLFGATGNTQHLVNTASGGTFVAAGNNCVIDGSQAGAGSTYWALDVGVGNTTLVGSTAITSPQQHDSFAVASVAGAMSAHTITINDFQSGDAVYLVGYGQADQNTFAQAVGASFSSGSALSFTLSDQTTVTFTGNHPNGAFDGGRDAL